MKKTCTGPCGLEKDLDAFGPHAKGRFGRQAKCRECYNAWHKANYTANKQQWVDRERAARAEDLEAVKKVNREKAARWRANPDHVRRKKMKYIETRYGIKYEEYERMEVEQGGVCKICMRPPVNTKYGRLHVDHDHKTGKVRGLLCHTCNNGLGAFQDNPDWMRRGAAYVEIR